MKHIVSFETAKALKAAGYPQPEFETGQLWYNWNGGLFMTSPLANRFFNLESGGIWFIVLDSNVCFYAPSATEIMEHERMDFCVCKCFGSGLWVCRVVDESLAYIKENHAEAAAELWLKLNAR